MAVCDQRCFNAMREPLSSNQSSLHDALLAYLANKFPLYASQIHSPDGDSVSIQNATNTSQRIVTSSSLSSSLTTSPLDRCVDQSVTSSTERPGSGSCRSLRTATPVVKSPNRTNEQSLGHIFLVHGTQTRRATLPNELTHIDTIRALFVCAFRGQLSMSSFQTRLIYVLDGVTGIFYELDDLSDVKDKTVLKVHELRKQRNATDIYLSTTHGVTSSPLPTKSRLSLSCTAGTTTKSDKAPPYDKQTNYTCKQHRRSPLTDESRDINYRCCCHRVSKSVISQQECGVNSLYHEHSRGKMSTESDHVVMSRNTERRLGADLCECLRRMETQLFAVSTWLQATLSPTSVTRNNDAATGRSNNTALANVVMALDRDVKNLRVDHVTLRHTMTDAAEKTRLIMNDISQRLLLASAVSSATQLRQVVDIDRLLKNACDNVSCVQRELSNLETVIDTTIGDVTKRQCRITANDVESLALVLSRITWSLADIKDEVSRVYIKLGESHNMTESARFACKRFLEAEQHFADQLLRRARSLMVKLTDLKKLADEPRDHRRSVSLVVTNSDVTASTRNALLHSIRSLVPDHDTRVRSIQSADDRRKRLRQVGNEDVEMLRFQKDIITARHRLRVTGNELKISARQLRAFQDTTSGIDAAECRLSDAGIVRDRGLRVTSGTSSAVDRTIEDCSTVSDRGERQSFETKDLEETTELSKSDVVKNVTYSSALLAPCSEPSLMSDVLDNYDSRIEANTEKSLTVASGSNDTIGRALSTSPSDESPAELRWSLSSASLESLLSAIVAVDVDQLDTQSGLDDNRRTLFPNSRHAHPSQPITITSAPTESQRTQGGPLPDTIIQRQTMAPSGEPTSSARQKMQTAGPPTSTSSRAVTSHVNGVSDESAGKRQADVVSSQRSPRQRSPSTASAVSRLLLPVKSSESDKIGGTGSGIAPNQLAPSESRKNALSSGQIDKTEGKKEPSTRPETRPNVLTASVLREAAKPSHAVVNAPELSSRQQISCVFGVSECTASAAATGDRMTGCRMVIKVRPPVPLRKSSTLSSTAIATVTPRTIGCSARDKPVDNRPKKPPRMSLNSASKNGTARMHPGSH